MSCSLFAGIDSHSVTFRIKWRTSVNAIWRTACAGSLLRDACRARVHGLAETFQFAPCQQAQLVRREAVGWLAQPWATDRVLMPLWMPNIERIAVHVVKKSERFRIHCRR